MRTLPFILFCLLTFALAFAFIHRNTKEPAGTSSNEAMPEISVVALEGNTPWSHSQLEGRVTLINFFASWCTPCAAEMPELLALKKHYPALHIAGIVWNDETKPARTFLKQHGNPYHSLWLDAGGRAGIALGIRGIPESYLVDSKGIIRFRLGAPLTPDILNSQLRPLIEQLLVEASHAS